MSKGTKQFRSGKLSRHIEKMETRLEALKSLDDSIKNDFVKGQIEELRIMILALKEEFGL